MPTGPVIVAEQLPDELPDARRSPTDFRAVFQKVNGAPTRPMPSRPIRSTAGWSSPTPRRARSDKAEPGTPRVPRCAARRHRQHQGSGRHARRLQLQAGNLYGVDERARVIVQLDNGQWKLRALSLRALATTGASGSRHDTRRRPHPRHRRPRQRRRLSARRARPGADLLGHAGGVRALRRRRRLRGAEPGGLRDRPPAADHRAGRDAGRAGRAGRDRAACFAAARRGASRSALLGWGVLPALPCLAAWAIAGRGAPALLQVAVAVAAGGADRAAARARRAAADRRRVGAGAADRLAGAALPALRPRPAVLRARRLAHRAARRRRASRSATASRSAARCC